MIVGIIHFQVDHGHIQVGQQRQVGLRAGVAVGFDQCGQVRFFLDQFEKRCQEGNLQGWFPAGNADTGDERGNGRNLIPKFLGRAGFRPWRAEIWAGFDACITFHTFGCIPHDMAILNFQGLRGTDCYAHTASITEVDREGIMAVQAVKVAALHEDDCPVARAIYKALGKDMVDDAVCHDKINLLLSWIDALRNKFLRQGFYFFECGQGCGCAYVADL